MSKYLLETRWITIDIMTPSLDRWRAASIEPHNIDPAVLYMCPLIYFSGIVQCRSLHAALSNSYNRIRKMR